MKKHIIFLFTILATLCASAQTGTKVKTVKLKTGISLNYEQAVQDSFRVIFTPEGDSLGIKIYIHDAEPTDYLYSQIEYVYFWNGQETVITDKTNTNKNSTADLSKNPEGWRLEFPRFYQGNNRTYEVTHSAPQYGITYSLEWDATLKANRWTCYQLYSDNMVKKVNRGNKFCPDPDIPEEDQASLKDYSGSNYSRGHLCPSGDRLCSREQNDQTFYLSNMQPQEQSHNGGVWANLENKVRQTWAPVNNSQDTLYVVKAATIDEKNIKTYTNSHLIVPKYFYMALLYYSKATGKYTAIGIWSPHEGGSRTEYISIDELEKRTGIDFFCNLPDVVENEVESKLDDAHWKYTKSKPHKR